VNRKAYGTSLPVSCLGQQLINVLRKPALWTDRRTIGVQFAAKDVSAYDHSRTDIEYRGES
jgi:hypothetical protein